MHMSKPGRIPFRHVTGTPKPSVGVSGKEDHAPVLWEMQRFLKLGLGSWCVYSSVWKPDPDLVKQLRAVSEPALSIGLMEIKTFLSSSAVLADLSYIIY